NWECTAMGGMPECGENEVLMHKNGKWECSSVGAAQAGTAIYSRNVPQCMNNELLTLQQGCSFELPFCLLEADKATACPPAPANCRFVQTDSSNVCTHMAANCDGDFCMPQCDQWEQTFCGRCDCDFPKVGSLLNN